MLRLIGCKGEGGLISDAGGDRRYEEQGRSSWTLWHAFGFVPWEESTKLMVMVLVDDMVRIRRVLFRGKKGAKFAVV